MNLSISQHAVVVPNNLFAEDALLAHHYQDHADDAHLVLNLAHHAENAHFVLVLFPTHAQYHYHHQEDCKIALQVQSMEFLLRTTSTIQLPLRE